MVYIRSNTIFKIFSFFLCFLINSISFASLNYHGRIINQSTNNPLIASNVRYNIKIKAGPSCVVYEENHDSINMSSSNGYFSINIGDGTPVFGTFTDAMKVDGSTVNCQGSGTVTLNLSTSKSVDAQILEFDGSSYSINIALIANIQIKEVPLSISAKNLEGKTSSDFIQSSGVVSQASISDIISGASSLYVQSSNLSSAVSPLIANKVDKSANLSDLTNISSARNNLGLGSIATLNSINDSDIISLSYSKLSSVPTAFNPSPHLHTVSDITGLATTLSGKINSSQLNLNCLSSETIAYTSVTDTYFCQSIQISNSQVSGLGTAALLNDGVSPNNLVKLDGASKIPVSTIPDSILNTSSTASGDVSGDFANLSVDKIKGVSVNTATPTQGQVLVYNGTEWIPTSGLPTYTRKTSDQTFSATAVSNVTSLSFSVSANSTYKYSFIILYTSAATTTGLRVGLTYPTVTIGSALAEVSLGGDGTGGVYNGIINSSGDTVAATGTPTAAPNINIARVEGIITPSASGTVQLQAGTEIAGSNVVIKASSLVEVTLVP